MMVQRGWFIVSDTASIAAARQAISAGDYARSIRLAGGRKAARAVSSDILAVRAEAMIKAGNFVSAEKALAELGRRTDADMALARLRGYLAIARRDDASAIAIHEAALAKRPDDEWHRIRLARALVRRGMVSQARDVIAQGLAARPDAFGLLIEDVAILRRVGMTAEAAERLREAQAIRPENARLYRHQGEMATTMGDHRGASALHGEALRLEPHIPGHRIRAVRSLEKAGQPDEALLLMQEGLSAYPMSAPLLAEIVRMRIRRDQPQAAAYNIGHLAEIYPDHGGIRELRAELAEATGDPFDAARQLQRQMARFPDDSGCVVRLADGLRRRGERGEALGLLRAIATPTPRSQMLASRLLIEQGRHDECRAMLAGWDRSEAAAIDRHRIAMRLASAEYRFTEAEAAASAILARLPDDSEAAKARALACTLTFDTDAAWGALRQIPVLPMGEGPARPQRAQAAEPVRPDRQRIPPAGRADPATGAANADDGCGVEKRSRGDSASRSRQPACRLRIADDAGAIGGALRAAGGERDADTAAASPILGSRSSRGCRRADRRYACGEPRSDASLVG